MSKETWRQNRGLYRLKSCILDNDGVALKKPDPARTEELFNLIEKSSNQHPPFTV